VVDCARRADHLDLHPTDRFPGTVESPDRAALADERLLRAGLGHHRGFLAVDVELGAVLVAVGAAADAYYPNVADRLGARLVTPEHGAVANAVGAAVGSVRMEAQLTIVRPRAGRFEIQGTVGDVGDGCSYRSLDEARAAALDALTSEVVRLAVDAGADPGSVMVTDTWDASTATVGGRELLVEATLRVVATGRPRFS